jgi:ABC-type molybdenum transport system ATPase subunit/photorepair protein PhrA
VDSGSGWENSVLAYLVDLEMEDLRRFRPVGVSLSAGIVEDDVDPDVGYSSTKEKKKNGSPRNMEEWMMDMARERFEKAVERWTASSLSMPSSSDRDPPGSSSTGHVHSGRERSGVTVATATHLNLNWQTFLTTFKLEPLLHLSMLKLSNGQLRRVRLAKALLFEEENQRFGDGRNPLDRSKEKVEMMILDEPFSEYSRLQTRTTNSTLFLLFFSCLFVIFTSVGLDVRSRSDISFLLGEISRDPRFPQLLLLLRPQDDLPSWVTHVLELEVDKNHARTVGYVGDREGYIDRRSQQQQQQQQQQVKSEEETKKQENVDGSDVIKATTKRGKTLDQGSSEDVVVMKDVNIYTMEGTKILDGVNWHVRSGEAWALLGPNGKRRQLLHIFIVPV